MKIYLFILQILSAALISCGNKEIVATPIPEKITNKVIPQNEVEKAALTYDNKTSSWKIGENLYSGNVFSNYDNGTIKERFSILNGKKQNESVYYYPDGHPKSASNYHDGKLHGEKKSWSMDTTHNLIAHLNYHMSKAHGEQRKWYPTGEVYQILNLKMGKEEGLQQAYRRNGKLYANYEAKEGRIFGLKKASLCFGLEDENIKLEK